MVRRVIEEDVAAPSTTVVEDDGSWIGRTVVTLVVLALLVAGAVWLVNAVSDNSRDVPGVEQNETGNNGGDTEQNDTDTNTDPDTTVPTSTP